MTSAPPRLAYASFSVPGATLAAKADLLRRLGLALELADDGSVDAPEVLALGVPVACVQAFRMHDAHPFHPEPARRAEARGVVLAALELAARVGSPRVLAVCGFGPVGVPRPFDAAVEFFGALVPRVRSLGLRLLVEPLSPRRAGAFTRPSEVRDLLAAVAAPDVLGAALDTGHMLDGGLDPGDELAAWDGALDELQLKGPLSAAPGPELPLPRWLGAFRSPPGLLVVEHREEIAVARLEQVVAGVLEALEAPDARGSGASGAPPRARPDNPAT